MKYTRIAPRLLVGISSLVFIALALFSYGTHSALASYTAVTGSTFSGGSTELSGAAVSLHPQDGDMAEITQCKSACSNGGFSQCTLEAQAIISTECNGTPCEFSSCYSINASANHTYVAPYSPKSNTDNADGTFFHHYAIYEPVSVTLKASPTSISPGGSSVLTWTTNDAKSCSIDNGIGGVSITGTSNGSTTVVSPTTTTTYKISCSGGGTGTQSATANATVTVNVPAPTATLTLSKSVITSGDTLSVTWKCVNSDYAKITNNNNANIGPESAMSGSVNDSPLNSGTYTLLCSDKSTGASATDMANITVNAAVPPITGTCSVSPTTAQTGDTVTWTAAPSGGNGTYTYSWSGTDGLSGSAKSITKSYSLAGAKSGSVIISSNGSSKTIACSNGVTVSVPAAADLTASNMAMSPSPTTIDTAVAFSADITNAGNATATNFPNTFQIQGLTPVAALPDPLSTEGAGVTKTVTASYSFASPGTYNVRACANMDTSSTNIVSESDYGNNCSAWVPITIKAPDLVAGATTPTAFVAGQAATISATITNNGTTGSGTFSNKFQRASDSSGTGQTSMGFDAMGNIAAGGSAATSLSYTFSAADAGASIYVRACADTYNEVDEDGSEGNNCGPWTKVTVLSATCSVSPSSGVTGDTITWSSNPAGGTGTYTYSWGGDDSLSGSTKNVSKSYSTSGAKSGHVTVSSGGVGIYVECGTTSIGIPAAPDLIAGSVTPTTAIIGVSTPLSATITNQGNATTGSLSSTFRNLLQVATDSSGTGATGIATLTTTGPLAASDSLTSTISYSTTDSVYWARICADSGGQVPESLEGNNCGPWTKITVQAPDITAGDSTAGSAVVGQATALSSTISNSGDAAASNVPSVFQIANPGDRTVTNVVSGLASGATKPITGSYTFPVAGDYSVRACGNMDTSGANVILEQYYGNNCGNWLTVTVSPAPIADLTANTISADNTTVTVGDTVSFTGTIWNKGTGDASGFPNILDVLNTSQKTASPVSMSLVAGATGTATGSYTFTTAGTYQVRFCANTNTSWVNIVTESDYSNNCGNKVIITVNPPPAPTCSLSSATNPASPNQVVSVSWNSTGATSCTETSNPDGFTTSGSRTGTDTTVNPPSLPRSYGATCTGVGGTTTCTPVTITNVCGNSPTLTITATPNRVRSGQSSVISWTGAGIADSACTISGPGISTVTSTTASCNLTPTPDQRTATNITKQSTYTLKCPSAPAVTATVNVIPKLNEF